MLELKKFNSEQSWVDAIVAEIEAACSSGACHIGLAGGSTPIPLYEALSKRLDLLTKIHAYEIDDRYISAEDEASNLHMMRDAFEDNIDLLASLQYFDTEKSIEDSLKEYAEIIKDVEFDVLLLGVGGDGHMASLFPGQIDTSVSSLVAHTTTEDLAVYDRLTVTLPVLQSAKKTILMTAGVSKKEVVDKLMDAELDLAISDFPASYLREQSNSSIYHLEE